MWYPDYWTEQDAGRTRLVSFHCLLAQVQVPHTGHSDDSRVWLTNQFVQCCVHASFHPDPFALLSGNRVFRVSLGFSYVRTRSVLHKKEWQGNPLVFSITYFPRDRSRPYCGSSKMPRGWSKKLKFAIVFRAGCSPLDVWYQMLSGHPRQSIITWRAYGHLDASDICK